MVIWHFVETSQIISRIVYVHAETVCGFMETGSVMKKENQNGRPDFGEESSNYLSQSKRGTAVPVVSSFALG